MPSRQEMIVQSAQLSTQIDDQIKGVETAEKERVAVGRVEESTKQINLLNAIEISVDKVKVAEESQTTQPDQVRKTETEALIIVFKSNILHLITEKIYRFGVNMKNLTLKTLKVLVTEMQYLLGELERVAQEAKQAVATGAQWLLKGLKKVARNIKNRLHSIRLAIADYWSDLCTRLQYDWAVAQLIFEAFWTSLQLHWDALMHLFQCTWEQLRDKVRQFFWAVIDVAKKTYHNFVSLVESVGKFICSTKTFVFGISFNYDMNKVEDAEKLTAEIGTNLQYTQQALTALQYTTQKDPKKIPEAIVQETAALASTVPTSNLPPAASPAN